MKNFCILFIVLSMPIYANFASESFQKNKHDQWQAIISDGNIALNDPETPLVEKAEINALLASTQFYLGNYAAMKTHIDACETIALTLNLNNYRIRSGYLLSAYYRIQQNFTKAKAVINQTMMYFNAETPNALKAKVYFNAGAAYADEPQGDIEKAVNFYQSSIRLLEPKTDDHHRTTIRLAKAYLLSNQLTQAQNTLSSLSGLNLSPRTEVQLLYVSAQLNLAQGKKGEAIIQTNQAIAIANGLQMQKELERLQTLYTVIKN